MDSLLSVLKNLGFLRYFKSDWARLIALTLVLLTVILLSKIVDWPNLVIVAISAIILSGMKFWFELNKYRDLMLSEVEKSKLEYKKEESKSKQNQTLL